jgi:hypothetical protein
MNVTLAHKALRAIRKFPEQHNQGSWVNYVPGRRTFPVAKSNGASPPCGTTMCFAGWVTFLGAPEGAVINSDGDYVDGLDPAKYGAAAMAISSFAMRELGLIWDQARALFHGARTEDHLTKMVQLLAKEPDAKPDALLSAAGIYDESGF